jgi:hypothetical protein
MNNYDYDNYVRFEKIRRKKAKEGSMKKKKRTQIRGSKEVIL